MEEVRLTHSEKEKVWKGIIYLILVLGVFGSAFISGDSGATSALFLMGLVLLAILSYDYINVCSAYVGITDSTINFFSNYEEKAYQISDIKELRFVHIEWKEWNRRESRRETREKNNWYIYSKSGSCEKLKYLWFSYDSPQINQLKEILERLNSGIIFTYSEQEPELEDFLNK